MEHGREQEETHRRRPQHGLATELVLAIVLSVVVAALVAVAGSAMVADVEDAPATTIRPMLQVEPEDLDPSDPLVMCEQFVDHKTCVKEPT